MRLSITAEKCPECGEPLYALDYQNSVVLKCKACNTTWAILPK